MTRRKSVAQPAPQTLQDALLLLTRYSTIAAGLAQTEVDRADAKAKIDAAADKLVAPMEAELRDIVRQLKPWWAVARDELTNGGKRKSIELAGCILGHRLSNPTIRFNGAAIGKANTDDAIATLQSFDLDFLLRTKVELDKPAILKAVNSDMDGLVLAEAGFSSYQREEFFVDAIPPRTLATREISDAPQADEVTA